MMEMGSRLKEGRGKKMDAGWLKEEAKLVRE